MSLPSRPYVGLLDPGSDPADGAMLEASFDDLANILDGAIDNSNIAAGANIDGAKLASGTVPAAALVASSLGATQIAAGSITDTLLLWASSTSGVKALRTVNPQRKIMTGTISVTAANWNGGAAGATSSHAVVFSSGADEYSANFTSGTYEHVFFSIQNSVAGEVITTRLSAVAVSGFTVILQASNNAVGVLDPAFVPAGTILVHWWAFGQGV